MRLAPVLLACLLLPGCSARDLAILEPLMGCNPMPVDEQRARARRPLEWVPARDEVRPLGIDDFRGRR